jgi:hypothetical protein
MSERGERAKKAGLLAVVLCAGTCVLLRSREPARPADIAPPAPPGPTASPVHEAKNMPSPPRASGPPAAPIIESVTLEKEEVCEGEENLVTVRAHTPDDNDAFLHFRVGAASGSAIPLRSYLDDRGHPSPHRISVFGKNNVATSVDAPPFRVKSCDAAPLLVIEHRLVPNTVAEFELDARITSSANFGPDAGARASFQPRTFVWSFGDGTQTQSREPRATHSFADRAQDTLYSSFLVTVEVTSDDGRVLKGRHSLELLNPAFEAFAYKGIVLLFADLNPHFPTILATGVVDQGVRLWHTRPDVVAITSVTAITRYAGDRGGRSLPERPTVSSVLGATRIPPGRGIEFHMTLDTHLDPDAISRDYTLEGRTADGHPVRGAFSVMKPPPLPTKERHAPISDPVLLAKVKMARTLLHREFVTDQDIWALERAGQFAGLGVDAGAIDPAMTSAPLPR